MIPPRLVAAAAIVAGAPFLVWPAFVNGYPLLFSDTGAFLAQTLVPLMIWDKPWVYGPLLHLFHWRLTLWLPVAAQALLLSHLLWLTGRVVWGRRPFAHVGLCAAAGLLTTAPYTIGLLMPDVFTPALVLCLFLLGFGADRLGRGEMVWAFLVATLGIAAHLSHLPVAAALVVLGLLLRRTLRPVVRMASPLVAALLVLLGTNLVGHGTLSLSPHGSTFLLARLQDDGPAARTIAALCPERGWYLCDFVDRMPMDSDLFLWERDSPMNRDTAGNDLFLGGVLLSAEAREIVSETIRREPVAVARAMIVNALRQLTIMRAGDTLGWDHVDVAVGTRIRQYFPEGEVARFEASGQAQGTLLASLSPLLPWHPLIVALSVPLALFGAWRAQRRGHVRSVALVLIVLGGAAANAFASGALSKPHHRYQARVAWLIPVAATMVFFPAPSRRRVEEPAATTRVAA
ncbi:hypothetical protein [Elioraea rosea]|uniref:hypothetical protein n=1 Tax=Elioraea rosea TaxID=2492390 RepID=UPI001950DF9E|nr:hypothetical protein [Elioraea rosea]